MKMAIGVADYYGKDGALIQTRYLNNEENLAAILAEAEKDIPANAVRVVIDYAISPPAGEIGGGTGT